MKIGDTVNKGTLYGKLLATVALCISLTIVFSQYLRCSLPSSLSTASMKK
ncbi:hypothetical protein [Paenibacillus stellifer]|nr:hypothetical protein [Paenibacillus stellifer]